MNALREFFHTQFIEEILAKYFENPAVSAAANLTIIGKPTALQEIRIVGRVQCSTFTGAVINYVSIKSADFDSPSPPPP